MTTYMRRGIATLWVLMVFSLKNVATQAASEQANYSQDAKIIIAVSISTPLVAIAVILCVLCVRHTRALKLRNKIAMREMIDNKNRNKMAYTPDKIATLDAYFKKHEAEVSRMFAIFVDDSKEFQQQKTISKGLKNVNDGHVMFEKENRTKQIADLMKVPHKVKNVYEEEEMSEYETNVEGTYSDIDDKQNGKRFGEIIEPELSADNDHMQTNDEIRTVSSGDELIADGQVMDTYCVPNEVKLSEYEAEPCGSGSRVNTDIACNGIQIYKKYCSDGDSVTNVIKADIKSETQPRTFGHEIHGEIGCNAVTTELVNIQDTDQCAGLDGSTKKHNKKEKNQRIKRKKSIGTPYIVRNIFSGTSIRYDKSGAKRQLKSGIKKIKGRPKSSENTKEYDHERRMKQSKKTRTRPPSVNTLSDVQKPGILQMVTTKEHILKKNGATPTRLSTATSRSSYRLRTFSRASNRSTQPSETHVSVSDIGLNVDRK